MSLKQIVVKNATAMSLNERFTKIRKYKEATSSNERVIQQLASSRNRRLAQHMERRPSVAAALKKDSIKSRLGLPGAISVRERLKLPPGFRARRGRGGFSGKSPLTRGLNKVSLMDIDKPMTTRKPRSPFITNRIALNRSRSRSRSRVSRSGSRSRARSRSTSRFRRSRSRSGFRDIISRGQSAGRRAGFRRGRGGIIRGTRNDLRSYRPKLGGGFLLRGTNRRGNNFRDRSRGRGRGRGGGGGGGRGRGRGRGRGSSSMKNRGNDRYRRNRMPTKEELDRELDQYMSTTKATLDKELDTMMSEDPWN